MDSYTARQTAIDNCRESIEKARKLGIQAAEAQQNYAKERDKAIISLEAQGYSKTQAYERSRYVDEVIDAQFAQQCAEINYKAENDKHLLSKLESRYYSDDYKREWARIGSEYE